MFYEEMRRYWTPGHNNYYPPESFVRSLAGTHPNVVVRWCNDRQRWELLELVDKPGDPVALLLDGAERVGLELYLAHILWCEEPTTDDSVGDYLPLGAHLLKRLKSLDVHAAGGKKAFLAGVQGERKASQQALINERKDYLYDFSRSAARYLRKCPEHLRGY
jgi:hypothetical protein